MHQVVDRALDLVLDERVLLHDVVLELQILKSLDHLLDLATHLRRILVLEVFDSGRDLLTPLRQVLIDVFAAPVTVSSEELRYLSHIMDDLVLVFVPHLGLLLDDLCDKLLNQELKLTQAEKQADQWALFDDVMHQLLQYFVRCMLMKHDPPDGRVSVTQAPKKLLYIGQSLFLLQLSLDDVPTQSLVVCSQVFEALMA